ncbi:hypothetical protein [Flaviaesturariibacter aridisoli]|uniref:Lipoprotein n=1 Tax=Flaviaesturariibacter aridisoli TaxID=2545761 RepID=A0A4R4E6Z7_9BACT|nr:hypothetical protein [Flaviaesturariibacter aridisoli]TCZ73498.1 hypothetical protein E0486_05930 [Flaviaesturariibacter aridisoli]
MKYLLLGWTMLLLVACRDRKEEPAPDNSEPFKALSFIKSQVRDVDTGLYNIRKIVHFNGRSDTSSISREQFRREAAPFLQLPDIASPDQRKGYTEQNLFDETLNRVVLFYTAKDPEAPLQRQQVLIDPNEGGGLVKTLIFDYYEKQGDYSVHRNLVWTTNDHFQISESVPGPGGTERIRRTEVLWNDFTSVSR